jgi:hypothetical protein
MTTTMMAKISTKALGARTVMARNAEGKVTPVHD